MASAVQKKLEISLTHFVGLHEGTDHQRRVKFKQNSKGNLQGTFQIRNTSAVGVLFKILSKSYETFVIRPSTAGYVQPSDRITVKVFVRDGAQFTGTEAFKVSVMGLSEDLQRKVKESQNLSTLFKEFEAQGVPMEVEWLKIYLKDEALNEVKLQQRDLQMTSGRCHRVNGIGDGTCPAIEPEVTVVATLVSSETEESQAVVDDENIPSEHLSSNPLEGWLPDQEKSRDSIDYVTDHDGWINGIPAVELPSPTKSGNKEPAESESVLEWEPLANKGACRPAQHTERSSAQEMPPSVGERVNETEVLQKHRSMQNEIDELQRRVSNLQLNAKFKDNVIAGLKKKYCKSASDSAMSAVIVAKPDGSQDGVVAGVETSTICPVTFEVMEVVELVTLKGDAAGNSLIGTCHMKLDSEHWKGKYPISLKLLKNVDNCFKIEACFPPLSNHNAPPGTSFGNCFLQLKFRNQAGIPVYCHHFFFDVLNGTCFNHTSDRECAGATFASDFVISMTKLSNHGCWVNQGDYNRTKVWLDVETKVMILQKRIGSCSLPPTLFSDKLTRLISAVQCGDSLSFRKIVFFCGSDGQNEFVFSEQTLLDYSPVFRALAEENVILGPHYIPQAVFRNMSAKSMETFYRYVNGSDDGLWMDSVETNIELLLFANGFLIVELAMRCVVNMLAIKDENLNLNSALALIQIGNRFGLECLKDRGVQWMITKNTALKGAF